MELAAAFAVLDEAHRALGPPKPLSAEQEDQMIGLPLGEFVRGLPSRACSWALFGMAVRTCLFEAACSFPRLAWGLLDRGLDPLACPNTGVRALHRSIYAADSRLVRRLLAAGVDPEESAGECAFQAGTAIRGTALVLALCVAKRESVGQDVLRILLGAGVALELDCADTVEQLGVSTFRLRPEELFDNKVVLAALREERRARAAWGELRRAWVLAVVRPLPK